MERPLIRSFFFGLAGLLLPACHSLYGPTLVNDPLIHDKGQVQVTGSTGSNGLEFHAAGFPAENIVLTFSYNKDSYESNSDTLSGVISEQTELEIGGGYYKDLKNDAVVGLLGGYGNGGFQDHKPLENTPLSGYQPRSAPVVDAKYHKFFFQPSIGFHHEIFDVSFANRFAAVDPYGLKEYVNGGERPAPYKIGGSIFWDHVLTGRVGYKFVKFQTQFGLSFPIYGNPDYFSNPLWVSVGVHVDLEPDHF